MAFRHRPCSVHPTLACLDFEYIGGSGTSSWSLLRCLRENILSSESWVSQLSGLTLHLDEVDYSIVHSFTLFWFPALSCFERDVLHGRIQPSGFFFGAIEMIVLSRVH